MTLPFGCHCQWAALFQALLFPACSSVLRPYSLAPACQSFEVSKRKTQAGRTSQPFVPFIRLESATGEKYGKALGEFTVGWHACSRPHWPVSVFQVSLEISLAGFRRRYHRFWAVYHSDPAEPTATDWLTTLEEGRNTSRHLHSVAFSVLGQFFDLFDLSKVFNQSKIYTEEQNIIVSCLNYLYTMYLLLYLVFFVYLQIIFSQLTSGVFKDKCWKFYVVIKGTKEGYRSGTRTAIALYIKRG